MKKLNIEINGADTSGLIASLEEVKKQIEAGYLQGSDIATEDDYRFDINEMDAPAPASPGQGS